MLHALKEYAEQSDGPSIKPGYKPKHVRWLILFDRKGHLLGVQPTGDSPRQQREFACCPDLSQPEMKAGGKGCRHFLVDVTVHANRGTGCPTVWWVMACTK